MFFSKNPNADGIVNLVVDEYNKIDGELEIQVDKDSVQPAAANKFLKIRDVPSNNVDI